VSESLQPEAPPEPTEDVGPDPVWGLGLFIVGLLIMGTGGAMTWHYTFNVGEGILLLGVVVFLTFVARTALLQNPIDWSQLPWSEGSAAPEGPEEAGSSAAGDAAADEEGGEDDDA
jgi:hypothetical protein